MSAIGPMQTGMCMYLHPRGFRGDRPGWFICNMSCKEVPKHRINNCVRGGCPDYRERDDEVVAGDKGKRIKWDEPASETVKEPSGSCAEETQPEAEATQEIGTCWNCGRTFPADSMHPDGDTLECDDCYRDAHEDHDGAPSFPCARCGACDDCSIVEDEVVCQACRRAGWSLCGCGDWFQAKNGETCCWVCADTPGAAGQELVAAPAPTPTPTATRCQRCECEVDGRLIMSGVGTVCEPCAEAIRQEWEAEQYPKHAPEPERDALTPFLEHTEAIRAAQAYLRHIGMGDKEVFALGIWLDAWAARGEAA